MQRTSEEEYLESIKAKRLCRVIIAMLMLIALGQIIAHVYSVNQLIKVSDIVYSKSVKPTSYTGGKHSYVSYSIKITLRDGYSYFVDYDPEIDTLIKPGDKATIYLPTTAYNLFSLDFLEYGTRASQLEINGAVVYSFSQYKHNLTKYLIFCALATLPFLYFLYDLKKHPVPWRDD
jgi:hypothetical protein